MGKQSMQGAEPRLLEYEHRLRIDVVFSERPSYRSLATVWQHEHSLEVENATLRGRLGWARRGESQRHWCEFARDLIVLVIGALLGVSPDLSREDLWIPMLALAVIVLLVILWFVLWRLVHPSASTGGDADIDAI